MNDLNFLNSVFESSNDSRIEENVVSSSGKRPELFLVEDDSVFRRALEKVLLQCLDLKVTSFSSPRACMEEIDSRGDSLPPFCLVSDISFDEGNTDGLLFIDMLKERNCNFTSIVMTGFGSVETAIEATKKGVFHYLTKPFELDILIDLVIKAVSSRLGYEPTRLGSSNSNNGKVAINNPSLSHESSFSKVKIEPPKEEDIFCGMIGRSSQMKQVFERIKKVAAADSTVFVTGELGTGKGMVAKAIHSLSARKDNSMICVNCGAIPSELIDGELFGHVKGAFEGVISDRVGRFQMADRGTMFLDEIGDMPLLAQVKILRVIGNKSIELMGDNRPIPVDVRVIAATHRNLEHSIRKGDFREDLYNLLNVIPVDIPPLRERWEDIPLLISYFLSKFVSADGRNNIEFDNESLEYIMSYDWPGNVRELENLIERLVILRGGSIIKVGDLPVKFVSSGSTTQVGGFIKLPDSGIDLKRVLSDIEDSLITQALELTNGNKNKASKILQLNRTTLIEKMKKKSLSHQDRG